MDKLKPLWDDIYLRMPIVDSDEEGEKIREKEIQKLQKKVKKIETEQMIQNSINQAIFSKLNPGAGAMPLEY